MELEVTWGRAVRIWWSYFWRSLIGILAAMLIGGVVGGIAGFLLGMLGAPVGLVKSVGLLIGASAGIAMSVFPIKLILGKDFGEFRLVLVQK